MFCCFYVFKFFGLCCDVLFVHYLYVFFADMQSTCLAASPGRRRWTSVAAAPHHALMFVCLFDRVFVRVHMALEAFGGSGR